MSQRPVLLAAVLPRHLEHGLAGVDPLEARDEPAVDEVIEPRSQQDSLLPLAAFKCDVL